MYDSYKQSVLQHNYNVSLTTEICVRCDGFVYLSSLYKLYFIPFLVKLNLEVGKINLRLQRSQKLLRSHLFYCAPTVTDTLMFLSVLYDGPEEMLFPF